MGKSLVIVESPAKARTINKYLGRDFVVKSSVGHIRDLPVSGTGKQVDAKARAQAAAKTRKLAGAKREQHRKEQSKKALFARMGDATVMPVFVTRIGWTRHRWKPFPLIAPDPTLDRDADTQRITQIVMDYFDAAIRAEPEQYFWYNKRWVLDPLPTTEPAPPVHEIPTTENS